MTAQHGAPSVGYDALRDLPLDELFDELGRIARLLQERTGSDRSRASRDHAADALRTRERAVVAEIRRRPGQTRPWSARAPRSGFD
jgi:hypothetical protein